MARDASDKPTLQDMREWKDALVSEFASLDDRQGREERLYFQQFAIDSPGGRFAVKTGSAPSDADSAVDGIVPADILVNVKPRRARDKYRQQATKLQHTGLALLSQWRRKRDPLRLIAADMAIRSVGVARVMVDPTLWPARPEDIKPSENPQDENDPLYEWEVKYRSKCPIIFQHRNPRYVHWREDEDGNLLVVVENYRTTVLEAKQAFGMFPATNLALVGMYPNDSVEISDVWMGQYRALMIEDVAIFPVGAGEYKGVAKHGYLEIPYVIAPFRELPFEDTAERYRGVLTNPGSLYETEAQALSMQIAMLAWNSWRTYKGWTRDGRSLEIVPGQYLPLDPRVGEYLELLQGEPVPPELLQTASVIDQYIQRNGGSQGPNGADGTRSGQQVWAIQSLRQAKLDPAKDALVRLIQRSLYLALQQIELNLRGETLTLPIPGRDKETGDDLGDVSVKATDIDGYWDCYNVSFGKRMDPAVLEQAKALSALAANNWMPLKVSWEYSGLADVPQDWEDALYLQSTDRQDFILQLAGLERVKQYYGEQSWQYQAMQQHIQQQAMAGQAGQASGAPGMATGGTMQAPSPQGPLGAAGGNNSILNGVNLKRSARPTGRPIAPRGPGGAAAPGG